MKDSKIVDAFMTHVMSVVNQLRQYGECLSKFSKEIWNGCCSHRKVQGHKPNANWRVDCLVDCT